jgi:hypothetical protein
MTVRVTHATRWSCLIIALLMSSGCVRAFERYTSQDAPPPGDALRDDKTLVDERLHAHPDRGRDKAPTKDGTSLDTSTKDAKVNPGVCISWSAWSCNSVSGVDYCKAHCGSFDLVCNSKLDCFCNGKWCGKNVSSGSPCDYCESSWNKGACCGY